MKKLIATLFLGIFAATLITSCGTKKTHCDAYGGKSSAINQSNGTDIPS